MTEMPDVCSFFLVQSNDMLNVAKKIFLSKRLTGRLTCSFYRNLVEWNYMHPTRRGALSVIDKFRLLLISLTCSGGK